MPSFTESVNVNGKPMPVYASVPRGSGPFPAVVVIHPAGGVNEFTKSVADRLAEAGFAAVAPNLFHRVTPEMLAGGKRLADFQNDAEIMADVNATVDWLRGHQAIDGERIGLTGFCMGGRIAWLAAASNPHFKAVVPFYGGNIFAKRGNADKTPFELTSGINCPMLFHFGAIDQNPSPADMQKLGVELTRLGKPHEFRVYPNANHAFMDFLQPDRYNKDAETAAWPRTVDFFNKHLKGAAVAAR